MAKCEKCQSIVDSKMDLENHDGLCSKCYDYEVDRAIGVLELKEPTEYYNGKDW